MKVRRFEWEGAAETTLAIHAWTVAAWPTVDSGIEEIQSAIRNSKREDRDRVLLELTARFDATETGPRGLTVPEEERADALSRIDSRLRESLELAAANVRRVAEAQVTSEVRRVDLPQGQRVAIREVPVAAAGIYAPGGRAAYPSSVLMCAIPARVAGVRRIALATPPGPDGRVNPSVLAAAALCEVDEVYAIGGAQAIFALGMGTSTLRAVNVIAGPGNAWVREAKRRVSGIVAIDSLAGPSELMVIADSGAQVEWIALDLCAQAEHGEETPLIVISTEDQVLDRIAEEAERAAASRAGVADVCLALLRVPTHDDAVAMANQFAPEHLELMVEDAATLAERVTTAGCVFVGRYGATAFGDYVAGSNHVLPTSGAGRFSGPLGPGIFRRKIATVEVTAEAAAKLAPHVDRIARAEGFPVHGESAMIRTEP